MSGLCKRDAAKLVEEIRRAKVSSHAISMRAGLGHTCADSCFVGALEIALQFFLRSQGCHDAAAAVADAMNKPPTEAELAARNAQLDSYSAKGPSASGAAA